jgi:hypothetical protein
MRRRIASTIIGAAVLVGVVAVSPSRAGTTIVCPPGCVLAGAVKAAGGQPDPTKLSIYGTVDVLVGTVYGDVANAATVAETYGLSIYGTVTPGPLPGTLKGSVLFYASRYNSSGTGYRDFMDTVQVSGTLQLLQLQGSKIKATLVGANGGFTGPMVYADVQAGVPSLPLVQQQCNAAAATAASMGVPTRFGDPKAPIRPFVIACSQFG